MGFFSRGCSDKWRLASRSNGIFGSCFLHFGLDKYLCRIPQHEMRINTFNLTSLPVDIGTGSARNASDFNVIIVFFFGVPVSVFYTRHCVLYESGAIEWAGGGNAGNDWGDVGGRRGATGIAGPLVPTIQRTLGPRPPKFFKNYSVYILLRIRKKKLVYYIYIYRSTENKSVEVIKIIEGRYYRNVIIFSVPKKHKNAKTSGFSKP